MASVRARAEELTAQLLHLSLREAVREYEALNISLFERRLRRPTLGWLDASEACLGQWKSDQRRLSLSIRLLQGGWGGLVEVLKHEMAHQYVDEVLGVRQRPHGAVFREVCGKRGIDARASGPPQATEEGGSAVLERVQKLLSLAASDNAYEAEAAMAAAHRLLLKHNLELLPHTSTYCFDHIGKPSGRIFEYQRLVALILGEHFFVQTLWVPVWRPAEGKRGSVIEVCGTRSNVELAAYVHDFLHSAAERLWAVHRRDRAIRSNKERREFLSGVMSGFRSKLEEEGRQVERQGLVWQGDPALRDYLKARHPHTTWVRFAARRANASRQHGHAAGQRLVLHRGLQGRSHSGTPLLLPERSPPKPESRS